MSPWLSRLKIKAGWPSIFLLIIPNEITWYLSIIPTIITRGCHFGLQHMLKAIVGSVTKCKSVTYTLKRFTLEVFRNDMDCLLETWVSHPVMSVFHERTLSNSQTRTMYLPDLEMTIFSLFKYAYLRSVANNTFPLLSHQTGLFFFSYWLLFYFIVHFCTLL